MTGNNVSGKIFQRTLFCLNARRETRRVTAVTNQVVNWHTNRLISWVTNSYSVRTTNLASNLATNQLSLQPLTSGGAVTNEDATPRIAAASTPDASTNAARSHTEDNSVTISSSPNQGTITANSQSSFGFNNQSTMVHSNFAITAMDSQLIRTEASQTVTCITNFLVTPVTNQIILATNFFVHDDYLYTEVTPPPDFTLASGDSLVLLADGTRFAFAPTNTTAAGFGRHGFVCTLYKVQPEALLAIANAREVKIRLRGINNHIERKMSRACRNRFRNFLLKYYLPEGTPAEWPMRSLDPKPVPLQSPKSVA